MFRCRAAISQKCRARNKNMFEIWRHADTFGARALLARTQTRTHTHAHAQLHPTKATFIPPSIRVYYPEQPLHIYLISTVSFPTLRHFIPCSTIGQNLSKQTTIHTIKLLLFSTVILHIYNYNCRKVTGLSTSFFCHKFPFLFPV
jgi:hypothetical protein